MAHQIQLRRDTAATWTAASTVLASGEIGVETDTGKFKVGDGATAWASLSYFNPGTSPPTTVDYLVGTSNGTLSNEIVVGTSPGGELGGTWASPTVDATHSGSSHASIQAAAEATAAGLYQTKAAFPVFLAYALSDETTAITTGTSKLTVRAPFAFTLTAVRASLAAASSSGVPTVDINEGGTTILSTKLTVDATEKTSTTAAAAAVISDSAIADDAELTFDIDVAGTGAAGLKVYLYGTRVIA